VVDTSAATLLAHWSWVIAGDLSRDVVHDVPPGNLSDLNIPEFAVTNGILAEYRESIDNIDAALIFLLAERFKITKKVGQYKADVGMPPADPSRETVQIARLRSLADTAHLDPEFSEKFLRFVIDEVIHHHERIAEAAQSEAAAGA